MDEVRSSRLIRQEFPQVNSRIPTLWTSSHFVATAGGATPDIAEHHVEHKRST